MDMPHVVAGTITWVRDLGYKRLCLHRHKEKVLQWLENSTTNVTDTEPSHTGQSSETKSRLST